MFIRRRQDDIPSLNTTATADISFMLLVFFLITSSMDSDKGLPRKLPPTNEQPQEQQDIHRSNVLALTIDAEGRYACDGTPVDEAELTARVESFVESRQSDRHMISVESDERASYDAYFRLQDCVVAAYHHLRQQMARRDYGVDFARCNEEQRAVIMDRYPQRISEAVSLNTTP